MGCVYSSRAEPPPPRDRSFRVVNVDDRGNEINAGDIRITDTDLVLSQGESSIVWPLRYESCTHCPAPHSPCPSVPRSLRRYGFDAELFSFECGRRCPTGPGIYAFRCSQAEELFNNLQEAINKCTSYPLIASTTALAAAPSHLTSCVPVLATSGSAEDAGQEANQASPSHSYVNAIHNYIHSPIYNGPSGDQSISMPLSSHNLPTTGVTDINTNYAKLDDLVRYYVNINTPAIVTAAAAAAEQQQQQQSTPTTTPTPPIPEVPDAKSLVQENGSIACRRSQTALKTPASGSRSAGSAGSWTSASTSGTRFQFPPASSHLPPLSSSPSKSHPAPDPVNYIMLDLDPTTPAATPAATTHFVTTAPATPISKTPKSEMVWPTPPDTQLPGTPTSVGSAGGSIGTNGPRMSYAMIDFDKTDALTTAAKQRKGLSIETSS